MSLAALIAAYHDAEGGALRATLPLAGRTLLERQARLAAAAGASPVILLVERLPPALLAAIDRLRAENLPILVARDVDEAADAVQPGDRLLVIADGLVADEAEIGRIVSAEGATLLTVADVAANERFERIDAGSRWAGLALLDGRMLHGTVSMLQDWDLQSTLLRRAVQSGARQLPASAPDHMVIAGGAADLTPIQSRILEHASMNRGDWVSRFLLAPVEQAAMRLLLPTTVSSNLLCVAAALLTASAAAAFATGWLGFGIAFLLLATPLDGISERLAAMRMQAGGGPSWWRSVLPALAACALVALAYALAERSGWGCLALAAAAIAFAVALTVEAQADIPGKSFLAERKGMSWLLLPFAATGFWVSGLAALACYAAGSFFWAQRQAHSGPASPRQD